LVPQTIDGAAADKREIRGKLWDISKKRAVYPQVRRTLYRELIGC
jgi:hypothetical protein